MKGSEEFFLTRVAPSTSGRARNQIPTSRELERLRSRVEQAYESNSGGMNVFRIPGLTGIRVGRGDDPSCRVDISAALGHHVDMFGKTKKHSSLTRVALHTSGGAKSDFPSVPHARSAQRERGRERRFPINSFARLPGCFFWLASLLAAGAADFTHMPYSAALWQEQQAARAVMPVYQAPGGYAAQAGSVNLLSNLVYSASSREQGHSGTCWIWGCQAVMSIDYALKNPGAPVLTNGFSVQFLASHVAMVDPPLFGGGTALKYAHFYEAMGYAIPWSNVNADWTDASGWYSKTPPATIHTQPNVPVSAVNVSKVFTYTNDEAVAIANLKSALDGAHRRFV